MKAYEAKGVSKANIHILKATIDAGKKVLETHTSGFSKAENDASEFWSSVEIKMKVTDTSSGTFEFIRDWFYDILAHKVRGGFATDFTDAPEEYIDDILTGLHRALTTSKGKKVKVWGQAVEEPPFY